MRHVRKARWWAAPALGLVAWSASAAASPVRLGTGSKGGDFDVLGQALAADVKDQGHDLALAPEITKGSCENIRRLLDGTLDFAFVQYDVAAEAHRASLSAASVTTDDQLAGWMCKISPELARRRDLRLLAAISDSAVHMLVRRPVRLDDLDDLESAPIFIGKDGSGSFETARVILGAAGHPLEQLTLFNGDRAWDLSGGRPIPSGLPAEVHAQIVALEKRFAVHLAAQVLAPSTLAYGLADSPAGMLAWILERWVSWSDNGGDVETVFTKDDLCTHATIYWVTNSIETSIRTYANNNRHPWTPSHDRQPAIEAPLASAIFASSESAPKLMPVM